MVRPIPCNKTISSEGAARKYRDFGWKDFGLPACIISDRGSTFVSNFTRALNSLLGITKNFSTARRPQTDGQTERINQEIEHYLHVFCNERQSDWAEWLSCAEFAINNKVNSSTGYSPFYLNYGRDP
jgi:transposase InsO family protein